MWAKSWRAGVAFPSPRARLGSQEGQPPRQIWTVARTEAKRATQPGFSLVVSPRLEKDEAGHNTLDRTPPATGPHAGSTGRRCCLDAHRATGRNQPRLSSCSAFEPPTLSRFFAGAAEAYHAQAMWRPPQKQGARPTSTGIVALFPRFRAHERGERRVQRIRHGGVEARTKEVPPSPRDTGGLLAGRLSGGMRSVLGPRELRPRRAVQRLGPTARSHGAEAIGNRAMWTRRQLHRPTSPMPTTMRAQAS